MKLYAHCYHLYEVRRECRCQLNVGTVTELPDDIGMAILEAHPGKVCNVTDDPLPEQHYCPLSPGYRDTLVVEAPADRMMRPAVKSRR